MKLEQALDELERAVEDASAAASELKGRSKLLEGELGKSMAKSKRAQDALKNLRVELKNALLTGGQFG